MTCGARDSRYFRKSAWTTLVVEFLQRTRQRAVAGADFDNGSIAAIDGLHNGVDDAAIVKKVLAEFSPASGRCPQPAL